MLKKSNVYLEYGSGNSSLVAKSKNKNFFSIESDKNFFNYIRKNFSLKNYYLKRFRYRKILFLSSFFQFKKKII